MGKNELMEKVIGEVAETDPRSGKAMQERLVSDSLRKLLNGKLEDGRSLMDTITEKALRNLLDNPNMQDLERLYNIVEKSENVSRQRENTSARLNETDRKLAELAKGKR